MPDVREQGTTLSLTPAASRLSVSHLIASRVACTVLYNYKHRLTRPELNQAIPVRLSLCVMIWSDPCSCLELSTHDATAVARSNFTRASIAAHNTRLCAEPPRLTSLAATEGLARTEMAAVELSGNFCPVEHQPHLARREKGLRVGAARQAEARQRVARHAHCEAAARRVAGGGDVDVAADGGHDERGVREARELGLHLHRV